MTFLPSIITSSCLTLERSSFLHNFFVEADLDSGFCSVSERHESTASPSISLSSDNNNSEYSLNLKKIQNFTNSTFYFLISQLHYHHVQSFKKFTLSGGFLRVSSTCTSPTSHLLDQLTFLPPHHLLCLMYMYHHLC